MKSKNNKLVIIIKIPYLIKEDISLSEIESINNPVQIGINITVNL